MGLRHAASNECCYLVLPHEILVLLILCRGSQRLLWLSQFTPQPGCVCVCVLCWLFVGLGSPWNVRYTFSDLPTRSSSPSWLDHRIIERWSQIREKRCKEYLASPRVLFLIPLIMMPMEKEMDWRLLECEKLSELY